MPVHNYYVQAHHSLGFLHTQSICLFAFVALRPKPTAMVNDGRSVHQPHFFLVKLEQVVNQYFVHILWLVTDNNPS